MRREGHQWGSKRGKEPNPRVKTISLYVCYDLASQLGFFPLSIHLILTTEKHDYPVWRDTGPAGRTIRDAAGGYHCTCGTHRSCQDAAPRVPH